jgi:hypothetical protein
MEPLRWAGYGDMGGEKSRSSLSGIEADDSAGEGMFVAVNADEGGIGRSVCLVFGVIDFSAVKKVDEKTEGEPCGEELREAGGEKKA